jgi:hypothetical protein
MKLMTAIGISTTTVVVIVVVVVAVIVIDAPMVWNRYEDIESYHAIVLNSMTSLSTI